MEKHTHTHSFHQLAYSSNGCKGQEWTRQKLGAKNSTLVYHIVAGAQVFRPSAAVIPDVLVRKQDWEQSSQYLNCHCNVWYQCGKQWLNLCHNASPQSLFIYLYKLKTYSFQK